MRNAEAESTAIVNDNDDGNDGSIDIATMGLAATTLSVTMTASVPLVSLQQQHMVSTPSVNMPVAATTMVKATTERTRTEASAKEEEAEQSSSGTANRH